MLQKFRERLSLVLICFLPFHALLVTVLTKVIAGLGHAPLRAIAMWKEALLGVMLVVACVEVLRSRSSVLRRRLDAIDICIVLSMLIAFVLLIAHCFSLRQGGGWQTILWAFFFGFKYDFLPLVAFFILRRVSWSEWLKTTVERVIITVGLIVAAYGILTFFLPMSFFTWLGYSDLHSLYLPHAPLAAFQQIGGSSLRRIQSVMSGPNQLGIWLLIPLGVMLAKTGTKGAGLSEQGTKGAGFPGGHSLGDGCFPRFFCGAVLSVALFLTFSRAAWIAAAVMIVMTLVPWFRTVPRKLRICFGLCLCLFIIPLVVLFPDVILRAASSRDHLARPVAAFQLMMQHPLGLSLGSAGPASNHTSDTCVMLDAGADTSWATSRNDLCVFVAGQQVQPVRPCHCPVLTENWYLQWGVEMGVLGLVLSILIVVFVLKALPKQSFVFLVFLGVSIAALFLHAWEDAAVALTVWVMIAVTLHQGIERPKLFT